MNRPPRLYRLFAHWRVPRNLLFRLLQRLLHFDDAMPRYYLRGLTYFDKACRLGFNEYIARIFTAK